jgi:hypothetical protein
VPASAPPDALGSGNCTRPPPAPFVYPKFTSPLDQSRIIGVLILEPYCEVVCPSSAFVPAIVVQSKRSAYPFASPT